MITANKYNIKCKECGYEFETPLLAFNDVKFCEQCGSQKLIYEKQVITK